MAKKKAPAAYWNYRVLASEHSYPEGFKLKRGQKRNYILFGIYEVHYKKNEPVGYVDAATLAYCEEVGDIKYALEKMPIALEKPILWSGDKFPQEYKSQKTKPDYKKDAAKLKKILKSSKLTVKVGKKK